MKTKVDILFWGRKLRKADENKPDHRIALVCRVTVNGKLVNKHTHLTTTKDKWVANNGFGYVNGKEPAEQHLNAQLAKMRNDLNDIHADLERRGKPVTAQAIFRLYLGTGSIVNLEQLFTRFLAEQERQVDIDISKSTLEAHRVRYGNLCKFLQANKLTDLHPEEFTHNMGDKLVQWLMSERKHSRNVALKNLRNVSQVLRWGVRREYLGSNPLDLYRYKMQEANDIIYLNSVDLENLASVPLASKALGRVRDCFIFQCWTGLAYGDLEALDIAKQAEVLPDGRRLLRGRRKKSTITKGFEYIIPLLPAAERILAKYGDDMPVPSNQLFNRSLKQIGEFAGISAHKMTSHTGRRTAGVVLLNAGIRMEVVSKVLGHSSIKMTEKAYAKILDKTVLSEFDRVFAPAPKPEPEPAPASAGRVLQMWKGGAVA
jgi:integrase/recombinase XerD